MLSRGRRPVLGFGRPATVDPDDEVDSKPTRVLPRTPVYPKDPNRNWEVAAPEKTPLDKVMVVFKDRRFHQVSELLSLVTFQELLAAMCELISTGYAFDRTGDFFRLRWRTGAEMLQDLGQLVHGISSSTMVERDEVSDVVVDDEIDEVGDEGVDDGEFDPGQDATVGREDPGDLSPGLVLSEPASSLTLPLAFMHSMTGAILAKRGSGKSYLGMVLIEELLGVPAGPSVVVFDPTGVWWGLCATDGGAPSSHEILLLGGSRGHLPLSAKDGGRIAEIAAEIKPRPIIVDMSEMAPAEQHEIVADFCERLLGLPKFQIHVVFDEADEFAPQRFGAVSSHQRRSLGFVERLVMRGRARGIGATLISLRPAVLSKNVLSQVDALYLLRMVEPNDLRAVKGWLENFENGITPEQRMQCLGLLPVLPVGTSYFLRGGDQVMFRKFKVRRKRTFDSSKTPDSGLVQNATLRSPSAATLAAARKILRVS
jgi:hypothetical protein